MALAMSTTAATSIRFTSRCVSSSSFNGQSLDSVARFTNLRRVARLVVQAKQGKSERQSVQSAVGQAMTNIFGEQNQRRLQHAAFVAANALIAMPAFAEEEKGKIFDFNLTLPIIVVQFLALMVALDNIWFKPVSAIMDSRDADIRSKLIGVRDNSEELKQLQNDAEGVLRAARAETAAELAKQKKAVAAELDAKLQESRAKIEKELEIALAELEKQKQETLAGLDSQVQALSEEIVGKVVPFKI